MTTQEFKAFCHDEFIKRGFVKKKSAYYLKGEDNVLCSLDIQISQYGGGAGYINVAYHIGRFDDPKLYPAKNKGDLDGRICVWSKRTYKGEHFWDALIDYTNVYSIEELKYYFDKNFEEWIMPPIFEGRKRLLEMFNVHVSVTAFDKTDEEVLAKLKE